MPEVNDIMQLRLMATFDGEPIVSTFGFAVTNAQASWTEQAAALVADFDAALGITDPAGAWVTGLSVQYRLNSVQVVDVLPGVSAAYAQTIGSVGTVTDEDAMPPNDCLCITWRSDIKGPGARGRNYLVGFAEGSGNAGYWEAGAQTYAESIGNAMRAKFGETGDGTARHCIIHKTSNGGVRGAPVVPLIPPEIRPVMSYTVQNRVASMGRRAVGRRIHRKRSTP